MMNRHGAQGMTGTRSINKVRSVLLLLGLFTLFATPAVAQDDELPRAAFLVYHCDYQPSSNTAQIRAVLTGSDGLPMPADNYRMTVTRAQTSALLPAEQVSVTTVPQRPPLRIILVVDITDTVPLSEIINALSTSLAPRLGVEDEVAMITVGSRISELTQFYLDKNRLLNEHLVDVRLQEGENRVYDAIFQAVSSFEPNGPTRQVVLTITDSGRRRPEQATSDDIIAVAQATKTQMYNIAYFYEDRPDPAELNRISRATQGYSWIYRGPEESRIAVGNAVADSLAKFVDALNTEIIINVDLRGMSPDDPAASSTEEANSGERVEGGNFNIVAPPQVTAGQPYVALWISADTSNDSVLSDRIICPIQILSHSIDFVNLTDDTLFKTAADIDVTVDTDLNPTQTRVVFWLNDAIVQDSAATRFNLNAPTLLPGPHTLRAQLRDLAGTVLATTRTATVYVQQPIELKTVDNQTSDLQGIVRFEAVVNNQVSLPDVQFRIGALSNPDITVPLGGGAAPVRSDGSAVLTVNDIDAEIRRLFPNSQERTFQVSAFIPGTSPEKPLLGESNVLSITLAPLPVGGSVIAAAPWVDTLLRSWLTVPIGVSLSLLIVNILLFRAVGRTRIQRMINRPDSYELTDRLMAITVRRSGTRKSHILTKKTMYVGRGASNDINLGDDPSVSRQHGVVMWRRGNWFYVNRKRNARVRINGKRLRGIKMYKLEPITEIDIGESHLIFHSNSQQDIAELTKTNL
jgi:hypothetical protein